MKNASIKVLFLVIMLFTSLVSISNIVNASEINNNDVFEDVVSSFKLYNDFFSDVTYKDNVILSNSGYTKNQAIEYLTKGYTYDLADKIISTYTYLITSSSELCIIATEGIPVVTEQDRHLVSYYYIDENNVILHMVFKNPYGFGEDYSYFIIVERKNIDKRWIVNELLFYNH